MKPYLFWLITTIAACAPVRSAEQDAELLFVRRLGPLLHSKCLPCHGANRAKIEGGLDVSTRQGLMKGGDSGEASITPGTPDSSPLYLAVTRTHDAWSAMPPKDAEKLTTEQIAWIKSWIAGGAPWPDAARTAKIAKANAAQWSAEDGVAMKTSGGLAPEWTNRKYKLEGLWAYQPVRKPAVPPGHENAIDAFLFASLPAGIQPAPPADRATLIRRATFDLTGLPPLPGEVEAFVKDPLPDTVAFAKIVERLLDSPHYGERMTQHWLDVVRYADSSGFANDFERGNAWRYRDYVVRAFNSDKPYDRFVREQIAGDELDPQNPEMLVATGFLRMGPWELTGMEVAKVARQRFLDDVTNSVGETFLAQSLQCARCHDHKFDPIPTRDYYSVQAVFATTQLAERPAAFLSSENTAGFEEREFLEQRQAELLDRLHELDAKSLAAAEVWFQEKGLNPAKWHAAIEQPRPKKRGNVFSQARNVLLKQGVPEDQFPPRMLGWTPEEIGYERIARKGIERLQWELDRYQPFALSVYNGRTPQVTSVVAPFRIPADRMTAGELEETCVLAGGNPFASGAKVKPAVLSVIAPVIAPVNATAQQTPIPDSIEGRRKAFADWVASPKNPLTTRAIVNRIWLWHFDQPLAGNPNNFGSTGKRPTHPELLDWLAATFVEQGWSFKAMHRLIMNSQAYRRSADLNPVRWPSKAVIHEANPALDGLGRPSYPSRGVGSDYAVFKPRRLTAEELRDAMLTATGELNRTLGGIPIRPEINLEAALQPRQVMGTFAAAWTPNPLPQQRHRRSLYALKLRGLADPLLEVFNAPTPDFSCERREASTITPQVFSLFNGQASHARALALAHRAVKETQDDEQAIARCFALAFARPPSGDELQTCLAHWRDMEVIIGDAPPVSSKPPLVVRREAVEENTGEKFSFNEKLHAYAAFVPDLQAADVPVHTRALADVCLALFNTNEFVYVY